MNNSTTDEAIGNIAIIGMAGRFPGAKNIEEFWQNLRNGVESVSFFSDQELLSAGIEPAILTRPNYVKAKATLDDVEKFDATFFGFTPKEAEITDPQQRLFLECAWEALENAGYDSNTYPGDIGVYGGVGGINTYLAKNLLINPEFMETVGDYQVFLGNDKDFLCTRVSYKLNLSGPSVTVQTACSTSLVAVVMACQSLLHYQCDMALAGGVAISLPTKTGYFYQQDMILSPDGHCRAFDAKAQGIVIGNGAGIVVLKRLEDALADGDYIHAIIKGSHINNDGASKMSYTAPSVENQARVIEEALALATIDSETITYVEAHGTGTPLGDPIEIAALTQAFGTENKGYCAIGSVKTNMGHLDVASGVAGLIKTVLALKHQLIPPSLHFEIPNPQIDFTNSPFYVNTSLSEWKTNDFPRRAGVSSFGVGGTNAHIVLEESPIMESSGESRAWQLLIFSAKTATALETITTQLLEYLKQHPQLNLADIAYTYQVGRRAFQHRRMLVCQTLEEAMDTLSPRKKGEKDLRVITHAIENKQEPSVVFMFSGQGTQYVNMSLELYQTEPVFREQVDYCAEFLKLHLNLDLRTFLYPIEEKLGLVKLNQTAISQPALFMIEYALAQLWMVWGVHPQAMIGHSIGEYVAACLAGVFSLEEALVLVAVRGQLMQSLPSGAMLAVPLSKQEIGPFLNKNIELAAINLPNQCVVSGTTEAVGQLVTQLAEQDIECQHLHTSHAFHSEMMSPILPSFLKQVQKIHLKPPQIPYLSNVTGTWISATEATEPNYWVKHIRQTVRFATEITEVLKESKHILLEIGPGHTLGTFAKRHPDKTPSQLVLSSLRHPKNQQSDSAFLLNTLGQLWLAGVTINWSEFYADEQRQRLPLPTYPFERQRYWIETYKSTISVQSPLSQKQVEPIVLENVQQQEGNQNLLDKKSDIADWFYIPSWQCSIVPKPFQKLENQIQIQQCWLIFIDECDLGSKIVTKLEQTGQEIITVRAGQTFISHNDHTYTLNPEQSNDYDVLLKTLHKLNKIPNQIIHLWRITSNHHTESLLEQIEKFQNLGFYSLLFLAQALGKQNLADAIEIMVVSNNMQAVIGEKWLCPDKATMLGAVKVIPQEYTNLSCRSIDIVLPEPDNQNNQQIIEQLWQEFTTKSTDIVIAYRESHRWVQTFKPIRLEKTSEKIPRLRQRGVYLIVGGLGAIGLTLAEYLAKTVQAQLILVGRSTFPPKNEWKQWLATHDENDSVSHKIEKLKQLENEGAKVLVLNANVAHQKQMQVVIEQTTAQFGQINGVIHAAGIIDYAGVIHKRTREMTENTLASKVTGTLVLNNLLQNVNLDFFVLCSSLGSILYHTKFGQVGYAAANEFLDAFAYYKSLKDKIFTITINWSDWQEIGISVEADKHWRKNHDASKNQSLLQNTLLPVAGVKVFRRILAHSFSRIAVSPQALMLLIEQDTLIPATAVNPLAEAKPSQSTIHPRPQLNNAYVAPRNEIEQTFANIWQEYLCIEQIGIHDDFFELGGDSLLAVQLISKLRKVSQTHLSSHSLLESSTIAKLAELIQHTVLSSNSSTSTPKLPSSLVQLQRGSHTKRPLFLVHPMGGYVFHYRDLAHYLGVEQPVYGIQAVGLDGKTEPLNRIKDMATHYIEILRSVQATGPYILGGHSFGGSIAFEMAQQLRAKNQPVALLVFIDTLGPDQIHQLPLKFENDWEIQVLAFLLEEGSNFSFWMEQLRTFETEDEQLCYFLQQGKLKKTLPSHFELPDVHHFLSVIKAHFQAMWTYTPQVYPGKIVLFKAKERNLFNPENPELSWTKMVTRRIDVHEIPGNHLTMNFSPNVKVMAEQLKIYLENMENED